VKLGATHKYVKTAGKIKRSSRVGLYLKRGKGEVHRRLGGRGEDCKTLKISVMREFSRKKYNWTTSEQSKSLVNGVGIQGQSLTIGKLRTLRTLRRESKFKRRMIRKGGERVPKGGKFKYTAGIV